MSRQYHTSVHSLLSLENFIKLIFFWPSQNFHDFIESVKCQWHWIALALRLIIHSTVMYVWCPNFFFFQQNRCEKHAVYYIDWERYSENTTNCLPSMVSYETLTFHDREIYTTRWFSVVSNYCRMWFEA